MKRIFAILLVVSIMILTLTSCNTNTIEELKAAKNEAAKNISNDTKSDITLNVYIVYDDTEVNTFSTQTVAREISKYTASKYNTSLNFYYYNYNKNDNGEIIYTDYTAAVKNNIDTKAKRDNENAADIVLINTPSLYNYLLQSGYLADLTSVLQSSKYEGIGLLIANSLLTSAVDTQNAGKTFVVPNNQVVGKYQYVAINRAVAEGDLSLSVSTIKSFDSLDKIYRMSSTPADFTTLGEIFTANSINFGENVKTEITGNYEDRFTWEEQGYIVNVIQNPLSSYEDVESGCFGITYRNETLTEKELKSIDQNLSSAEYQKSYDTLIQNKQNERIDRCMEIIYAFSNDFTLHNMLLYGVNGINYNLSPNNDGYVTRVSEGQNVYKMNPLHTGDLFSSYYCTDLIHSGKYDKVGDDNVERMIDYTPLVKQYGQLQNSDSTARKE